MDIPQTTEAGTPKTTVRDLGLPVTPEASDAELLEAVVAYYAATLARAPPALEYLRSRGLTGEALEHFRLGFSDRTLGLRLPMANRKAGAAIRERLMGLGILKPNGHEAFRGMLTIPLTDEAGQVVQLYGRMVSEKQRAEVPRHLWSASERRGLVNRAALGPSKTLIVAGSLIDALTWWSHGHRNVVAGAEGDLLTAIGKAKPESVVLAYRRDGEGEAAAQGLREKLVALGIAVHRVQLPSGQDANDLARGAANPGLGLADALRTAVWESGASPAPPSPPPAETPPASAPEPSTPDEVVLAFGPRRYRARGLARNAGLDTLKVNLLVSRSDAPPPSAGFHVDVLDVYQAKQRAAFVKLAAQELGEDEEVLRHDLAKVLFALEEAQEAALAKAREPTKQEAVELTVEEKTAALGLLKDPKLLERVAADLETCGLVGEGTNKLVAYLAVTSRKLDEPLAIVVQSSSAAGKTSLMEAVLSFVPPEDRVKYSAMTGQSLFYMGETGLRHRVLAIVEEAGAQRAAYALKLLQSEGELTIASTGKEPSTGRLVSQEYRVQGPVMLFLTTTAIDIEEELLNRCLVLTVDEDREQTRAIHRLQRERETLAGMLAKRERESVLKLHQNAQRLLRPLLVVNPFARELTFLDDRTRTRRDHLKYLTLIRAIALLFQHQREVKTEPVEHIEVSLDDIAVANRLIHEVLGHSLDDLPPHSRRLAELLHKMAGQACEAHGIERRDYRFTRRDIRAFTGWSDYQVRRHLAKLVSMEQVLVHRGGRGQLFEYELLFDGQGEDGRPVVPGLLDVEALRKKYGYGANPVALPGDLVGGSWPVRGPIVEGSRAGESGQSAKEPAGMAEPAPDERGSARPGQVSNPATYAQGREP